eukprot:357868-Chlamydomonas_euryale.AAC.2
MPTHPCPQPPGDAGGVQILQTQCHVHAMPVNLAACGSPRTHPHACQHLAGDAGGVQLPKRIQAHVHGRFGTDDKARRAGVHDHVAALGAVDLHACKQGVDGVDGASGGCNGVEESSGWWADAGCVGPGEEQVQGVTVGEVWGRKEEVAARLVGVEKKGGWWKGEDGLTDRRPGRQMDVGPDGWMDA